MLHHVQGLDVGPESTEMIKKALSDCQTILWNGPMGVFEFPAFAAVRTRPVLGFAMLFVHNLGAMGSSPGLLPCQARAAACGAGERPTACPAARLTPRRLHGLPLPPFAGHQRHLPSACGAHKQG